MLYINYAKIMLINYDHATAFLALLKGPLRVSFVKKKEEKRVRINFDLISAGYDEGSGPGVHTQLMRRVLLAA